MPNVSSYSSEMRGNVYLEFSTYFSMFLYNLDINNSQLPWVLALGNDHFFKLFVYAAGGTTICYGRVLSYNPILLL